MPGSFTGDTIVSGLTYGHIQNKDGHYWFKITDNTGSSKISDEITFLPVQTRFEICGATIMSGECMGVLYINGCGDIPSHDLFINGVKNTGSSTDSTD